MQKFLKNNFKTNFNEAWKGTITQGISLIHRLKIITIYKIRILAVLVFIVMKLLHAKTFTKVQPGAKIYFSKEDECFCLVKYNSTTKLKCVILKINCSS